MEQHIGKQARIAWLDLVKAISIILVVYYHFIVQFYVIPFDNETLDKTIWDSLNYFIAYKLAPLRMPLFFLVSGYLSKNAILKSWKEIAPSRIYLFIYLFVLWGIIQRLIIYAIGSEYSNSPGALNSIYSESIVQHLYYTLIGASSLWYLYALVVFFILCKLSRKQPAALLCILAIVSISSAVYIDNFPYRNMLYCAFFYAAGCFWGEKIFLFIDQKKLGNIFLMLPLALVVVAIELLNVKFPLLKSILYIYIVIILLMSISTQFNMSLLEYVGKRTLSIYVIHRPLMEICRVFLAPYLISLPWLMNNNHILYSILLPVFLFPLIILSSIALWKLTNNYWGTFLYDYRKK